MPRYGVNRNPEEAVYVLQESAVIEDGPYTFRLEDAWWREGALFVDMTYTTSDSGGNSGSMMMSSGAHAFSASLEGLEGAGRGSVAQGSPSPYGETPLRLIFEGDLPPDAGGAAHAHPHARRHGDPAHAGDGGGEHAQRIGSLFPRPGRQRPAGRSPPRARQPHRLRLPAGRRRVLHPALAHARRVGRLRRPEAPVTVTSADGSVLTGEPLAYTPFSGTAYTEWDFGPAESGDYVLDIPYVYQNTAESAQPVTFTLPLPEEEVQPGLAIELPGGVWTVERIFPVEDPSAYLSARRRPGRMAPARAGGPSRARGRARTRPAQWRPSPCRRRASPWKRTASPYPGVSIQLWTETVTQDGASGTVQRGFLISALGDPQEVTAKILPESICYRWNHAFSLEIEVPPEEELPSFSASAWQITLTASPRRANGEVWISLEPSSQLETIVPAAGITRGPALAGAAEDITLTAADGTVYTGVYRPGREDGYSDWGFGDLPAGDVHASRAVSLSHGRNGASHRRAPAANGGRIVRARASRARLRHEPVVRLDQPGSERRRARHPPPAASRPS